MLMKKELSQEESSKIVSKVVHVVSQTHDSSTMESLKSQENATPHASYLKLTYKSLPIKCFYCELSFDSLVSSETHQFLHCHVFQPNNNYFKQKKWTKCRRCGTSLSFEDHKDTHICYNIIEKEILSMYNFMNDTGVPLFCMLCDLRPIESRTELIIHLMAFHSQNFHSEFCPICDCRFRSTKPFVKEEHMKAEHFGDMELNFLRTSRIGDGKSMSLKQYSNPMRCTFRIGSNEICGLTFKDLALFTLHILCYHCRVGSRKMVFGCGISVFHNDQIQCYKCDLQFPDHRSLDQHIEVGHQPDFERQLSYHIRRGHFKTKYDAQRTCLLCLQVLPNQLAKQVHNYVIHWSTNWRQCGLCLEEIISDTDLLLSDNLQYKLIRVHEVLHLRSIQNLGILKANKSDLLNDFNLSLVEKPVLYIGTYIPVKIIQKEEKEKELRKRIFPKELKRQLVHLGKLNRKVQEALEIFD